MSLAQLYATKTSRLLKQFYREYTWAVNTKEKEVYITFDDGPHPEITPWVLDQLAKFNAKATFFCVGANVEKYPEVFKRIIKEGHAIGNHTHHHVNGWDVSVIKYFREVIGCDELVHSPLLRPPYGKIRRSQAKVLKRRFKIIMWDVLTWDYRQQVKPLECLDNVKKHTEPGSIIVFHDSEKARKNLEFALPQALHFLAEKEYVFKSLDPENL